MFGALSWFYKDLKTKEFTLHSLISGIERGSKFEWSFPELNNSENEIKSILLHTLAGGKIMNLELNERFAFIRLGIGKTN